MNWTQYSICMVDSSVRKASESNLFFVSLLKINITQRPHPSLVLYNLITKTNIFLQTLNLTLKKLNSEILEMPPVSPW